MGSAHFSTNGSIGVCHRRGMRGDLQPDPRKASCGYCKNAIKNANRSTWALWAVELRGALAGIGPTSGYGKGQSYEREAHEGAIYCAQRAHEAAISNVKQAHETLRWREGEEVEAAKLIEELKAAALASGLPVRWRDD